VFLEKSADTEAPARLSAKIIDDASPVTSGIAGPVDGRPAIRMGAGATWQRTARLGG